MPIVAHQPTPNTAAPLWDADAATTDPNTRCVRANTLVCAAAHSTAAVERLLDERAARYRAARAAA
ncbi:hypothetical protein [Streptomyces sp. NPDC002758]